MRKLLSVSLIAALAALSACGSKPNHIFNVENDSPNGPRGYFCRDKPTGIPESLQPQPGSK